MMIDYNDVVSLSEEEFQATFAVACAEAELADPTKFTMSDEEDIAKMERLLDVRPGALAAGEPYYLQSYQCECGRILTTYDFVFTALVDAGHSKSLILHTFIGNKLVINKPRNVRCSECARISPLERY